MGCEGHYDAGADVDVEEAEDMWQVLADGHMLMVEPTQVALHAVGVEARNTKALEAMPSRRASGSHCEAC